MLGSCCIILIVSFRQAGNHVISARSRSNMIRKIKSFKSSPIHTIYIHLPNLVSLNTLSIAMSLPRRNLKDELLYFCHKHPTITDTCKSTLVLLSTPICCCICCCCWVGYCGRGDYCVKGRYRKEKQARMDLVHWRRKAHTLARRNSLSIGTPTTLVAKLRGDKLSDQAACPLFSKLAREIRESIYQSALTESGAIHWGLTRDWHHRFSVPKAWSCLPIIGDPTQSKFPWESWRSGASGTTGCALLRTCRRIYTEAIPILYSKNQFRFNDGISLHAFAATTPTSRLKNIRSLRIDGCEGMGEEDMRAVIRLKCWENLRVMYLVHNWPIEESYDPRAILPEYVAGISRCIDLIRWLCRGEPDRS